MTFRRLLSRVALASIVLAACSPVRAGGTLGVCLDDNIPPLSSKRDNEMRGFDLAVAEGVAQRLGLKLSVQWVHGKADNDSNPTDQANALLSDGRCQLVGGLPLIASTFGEPGTARSKLPDFDGMSPDDRRRWVGLGRLAGTRPYRFNPHVVILGPRTSNRTVHTLDDLKDVRLGSEEGTLADAILMTYGGNKLIPHITHVVPGRALFDGLEHGDYDAALVELHRLDGYRASHPGTAIASSGHYHTVGFNVGFVGLASNAPLIEKVNAAIDDMLSKGVMPALAQGAGLTYVAPRRPDVLDTISPAQLRGD